MDKKNVIFGILLIGAAFGLMFYQGKLAQDAAEEQAATQQAQQQLEEKVAEAGEGEGETTAKPTAGEPAQGNSSGLFSTA
ncbi:MAG: hypothetical protein ACQKBW_11535, partial [Puniceicoccales bacterium]